LEVAKPPFLFNFREFVVVLEIGVRSIESRGIKMSKGRLFYTIITLGPLGAVVLYPVIAVYTVYSLIKDGSGWLRERMRGDRPLTFFYACVMLSTVFSQDILISLLAFSIFTIQVFAYVIAGKLAGKFQDRLLNDVLLVGSVVSLIGIIQYLFIDFTIPQRWLDRTLYNPEHYKRVFSTFFNPNVLAGYLILIISLSLSSLNRKEAIKTIGLVLALLCLFFTFSRGGWIGAMAAVLTTVVLKRDRKSLAVFVLCMAAITAVFWADIAGRANGALNDSTFGYRVEIWRTALEVFGWYPLFGCGFGTSWKIIPTISPEIDALVGHAHNLYLNFAMETGVVGLSAFVVFIASRIARGYHRLRTPEGSGCDMTAGIVGGVAGMLVHGFVDAVPIAPQLGIVIWLLLGAAGI